MSSVAINAVCFVFNFCNFPPAYILRFVFSFFHFSRSLSVLIFEISHDRQRPSLGVGKFPLADNQPKQDANPGGSDGNDDAQENQLSPLSFRLFSSARRRFSSRM
jgi:hypothetical protein